MPRSLFNKCTHFGRKMGAATTPAPYGFWATNPTKKLAHWVYLLGQPLSRNRVFQNFSGEPPPPPPPLIGNILYLSNMSTRSSALPTDSRFSRGTLVTVLAGCFDDDDGNSDDESHWSGKFKNGSKQELFGVVDNVYATRCDVYFFDDKMTTKVNVESLILKADQELVILGDGSEWKREAFSSLVSLDGEKSKTVKTIKSNESSSTFEFNEEHLKIENNRNMKRKVADRDVLVLKVNAAKRPSLVTTILYQKPSN